MIRVAGAGDSITWGFTIVNRRRNSYPFVFPDSRYLMDGVHPQTTGAGMLAEAIYSRVKW